MLRLPFTFFEKSRVGELTSRITADVTQLQEALSWTLGEFLRQIFTLVIGIALIFFISPTLTFWMLLTFPPIVIVAVIFGKYIKKLSRKTQDALANANVIVEESLTNIQVVKSFTNEPLESNRYASGIEKVVGFAVKAGMFRGAFASFFILGIFGGIIIVLWKGMNLIQTGEISNGDLTSFVLYTIYIGASLGGMSDLYSRIQKAIGANERILEISDSADEANLDEIKNTGDVKGVIEFNNLNFNYPSRPELPVLKNINLHIKAGEKIALVGPSGAGKSTITQLLLKFYGDYEGGLSLDGQDLKDLNPIYVRDQIGVVQQEVILFGGTIRENILYGNPSASEAAVIAAAEKANAMEFINKFDEGMEALIGERGVKLSGGQRQRIAIARAILKDPVILILDEATSSLDSESEQLVQTALEKLMQNRTAIVIAHRLSTVRNVDRIVVIENGQIVEQGKHEELQLKENGLYKHLLELQFDQD
ncbi:UNVERIFIED_CONTAM: hypothetical protein GTU68_029524 [Idotea baltica]|nr:hypothetical protein [Idotea baltica]